MQAGCQGLPQAQPSRFGAGNAEAKPCWRIRKAPHENAVVRQSVANFLRKWMRHEPEEGRPSQNFASRSREHRIEAPSAEREPPPRLREPSVVAQSRVADSDRRSLRPPMDQADREDAPPLFHWPQRSQGAGPRAHTSSRRSARRWLPGAESGSRSRRDRAHP